MSLLEYSFIVVYKPGVLNRNAGSISRITRVMEADVNESTKVGKFEEKRARTKNLRK